MKVVHSSGDAPRILFVVHTSTAFMECFRVGKLLLQQGMRPVFVFGYAGDWTVDAYSRDCREAGIEVHSPPGSQRTKASDIFRHFANKILAWLSSDFLNVVAGFVIEFFQLRGATARIRALFRSIDPDLLILSIDIPGYDTAVYVKVAHQFGRKAILLSMMMTTGLGQAEVYYHDRNHHVSGVFGRLIARLFPKWVITHRSRPVFRVPPGRILAMELLRLAPPKPWLFNSSWADVINMESEAMVDYFATAGMPRERMILTGSTTDDVMVDIRAHLSERREALCRSLGLPIDRPIILTALPPNFLRQSGGRPECDFDGNFDGLIDFWFKCCCSVSGYNVIVALHPSVPASEAEKLERYGARVAKLNTAELIPLCDFFVASVSSTIRWAIACGIPVVNYDVYRYRYHTDFIGAEGVLTCEEQDEFKSLLKRMASDPEFAAEVRRKQMKVAGRWGWLDGRSGERLVQLVKRYLPAAP
jgi:hypothetical protein